MTRSSRSSPTLRVRLLFDSGSAVGPGKTDLLEKIAVTGSIAAAGRAMDMSYKRAWKLVNELNISFAEPLVSVSKGGSNGGGAELTPVGRKVLAVYRRIERKMHKAIAAELRALNRLLD
jgi:molybdate transport system regulatory protein